MDYQIKQNGDQAISIYFENKIEIQVNKKVHFLMNALKNDLIVGVKGYVPAYQSLLIYYDSKEISYDCLLQKLNGILSDIQINENEEQMGYRIPVLYNGADLAYVANYHGMPINEVVERHEKALYYIYFLGFSPGFPYLGGLDPQIATPRLKQPKIKIEAGSVGIADHQTGVYTVDSPGGWQVIGKTPYKLYENGRCVLEPGRYLKFYSIDNRTYQALLNHTEKSIPLEVLK